MIQFDPKLQQQLQDLIDISRRYDLHEHINDDEDFRKFRKAIEDLAWHISPDSPLKRKIQQVYDEMPLEERIFSALKQHYGDNEVRQFQKIRSGWVLALRNGVPTIIGSELEDVVKWMEFNNIPLETE